jgi:transposase
MARVEKIEIVQCPHCEAMQGENLRLRARTEELEKENERIAEQHDRDQKELSHLKSLLEKERRAGKRQSAPFSKGSPKAQPRRPGRKPGSKYGKKAHREPPKRVDETLEAPLPESCPDCGGELEQERVVSQFQMDLPAKIEPWVTRFLVSIGLCTECGSRIQGRHPHQTSDALGAAVSQIGPRALALAAELKLITGISYDKLSNLFENTFSIPVTRGGLCLALQRLGRAAKPTYEALKQSARRAPWVSPDETGWRVGAVSAWLWVYVTSGVTVYAIEAGRGFKEAAKILGEDFCGILVRDGWIAYGRFLDALHQTCLAHLLRRCHENLETALGGTARFPHAVKRLLKKALKLRDRRDAGEISAHGLAVATGKLKAAMKRLLNRRPEEEENRRFAKHLRNEQEALFTFLKNPGLPATNYPAEQALRFLIAVRKNCGGGHRTWKGARTYVQLASVWRTALQQALNPRRIIVTMLRSPKPTVVQDLLPRIDPANPTRSPPKPASAS